MKAKKRKMISFFMLILLPGILCACGEKRPVSVVVENDTSQTDGESLKSKMEVPEKVYFEVPTGSGTQIFSPEIAVPEATSVGVYQLEEIVLTTDYMNEFCKNIFDGAYDVILPNYIYTREELESRRDVLLEKVEAEAVTAMTEGDYQSCFLHSDLQDIENRLENYKEEWETCQVIDPEYTLMFYPAPDSSTPEVSEYADGDTGIFYYYLQSDDISCAYVMAEGMVEGRLARVTFMETPGQHSYHIRLDFEKDARNYYKEYPKHETEYLDTAYVQTEAEAIEMAEEYVEKLGFSDMALIHTEYLMEYDTDFSGKFGEMGKLTGYQLTFGLCKNGVSVMYYPEYRGTISVDIGSNGLEGMYIRAPYRIVSGMTEESELLSFEQIQKIAEIAIEARSTGSIFQIYQVLDKIEFGYEIVSYEDGDILMPAWRYGKDYNSRLFYIYFTINAVDGSILPRITEGDLDAAAWRRE